MIPSVGRGMLVAGWVLHMFAWPGFVDSELDLSLPAFGLPASVSGFKINE